jgi:hypothetical protein
MERSGSTSEIHVHCRTVWSVGKCSVKFNMVLPVYNLVEYSGQVMNKNKINMMSRNETKRNMAYVDDLIIN